MAPEETCPAAALVVPVPAADWLVLGRRPLGAHVPLLVPFPMRSELTDGLVAELGLLFAEVVPFSFDLDAVCAFPTGGVYLAPKPTTPFRQLTTELGRRFPTLAPSAGQFPDVVPHVAVPLVDGETLADVELRVRAHGPLQGLATTAQLVRLTVETTGSTADVPADVPAEVLAEFPFGTAAA